MSRSDRNLQALAELAGALAGRLAGDWLTACNPQTSANAGESANLQGLQAPHVGAHLQVGACLGASGRRQGRAGALTHARVLAPATWKKEKGDNHLKRLQAETGRGNHSCNPCSACNRSPA